LALPDLHIFLGSIFYTAQIYRAEGPCSGKVGPPVPAEDIVGCPPVRKSLIGIVNSNICMLVVRPDKELQRRPDDHLQHTMLAQVLSYRRGPGSVHVFCTSQIGTVKPDIRHGTQSFKGKEHPGI